MTILMLAWLAALAGTPIDADGDTFDSSVDCDDSNPLVNPGATERCEPAGTPSVDDDCDGNPNTKDGVYTTFSSTGGTLPANAQGWFHPDADGDGFGSDTAERVALCDAAFETTIPVDWRRSAGDCDDTDPDVSPLGIEVCDERDNDCNTLVDEPAQDLTPELDPRCVWHHTDADDDSFGSRSDDGALCLCPAFEVVTLVDGVLVHGDHPTDCATPISPAEVAYGHLIDGTCLVPSDDDCDDLDASIKPAVPGVVRSGDILAPVDVDCDGTIPAAAIDCDGDGAIALPPAASEALLDAPRSTPVTAADLGLPACGGPPPTLTCMGQRIALGCDDATGLWTVSMALLVGQDRSTDGVRLDPGTNATCGTWDCDDTCPARCVGASEVCDGLDNDCASAVAAALAGEAPLDDDGIPDAMDPGAVDPGLLHPAELDLDGEGGVRCEGVNVIDATEPAPAADCSALTAVAPLEVDSEPDPDEPVPATCGCDGGAAGLLWVWTLVPALLWRRRA